MKEPEIDIEEDSTDIEVIEIDSDTIDGAAADSDAAPNIQNVSEENEPPVQPDNEIENTDTTEQTHGNRQKEPLQRHPQGGFSFVPECIKIVHRYNSCILTSVPFLGTDIR